MIGKGTKEVSRVIKTFHIWFWVAVTWICCPGQNSSNWGWECKVRLQRDMKEGHKSGSREDEPDKSLIAGTHEHIVTMIRESWRRHPSEKNKPQTWLDVKPPKGGRGQKILPTSIQTQLVLVRGTRMELMESDCESKVLTSYSETLSLDLTPKWPWLCWMPLPHLGNCPPAPPPLFLRAKLWVVVRLLQVFPKFFI